MFQTPGNTKHTTSDMASKEDPFSSLNILYIGLTLKYPSQTKLHLLAVRLFTE
jgi:hypothetical protein